MKRNIEIFLTSKIMKKILVFGATGHLGAYTVDYLLKNMIDNFEIIAVGRKKTNFFRDRGVRYIEVDITRKEDFEKLPTKNVFALVDLVGIMPAAMKGFCPKSYTDVNVSGTLNILEYCRENEVNRIIFTQTEADLSGHWKENIIIKPDMKRKFSLKGSYALYIITKCTAIDMIESYYRNFGLKRFVLRLPTVYHYRPDPYYYKDGKKIKLAYRQIIDKAIAGEEIELWGNPDLAKDIVYVKDFAQIVKKSIVANVDGGIYNVGFGEPTTLEEQIKGIVEVFSPKNNKSPIIYKPNKRDSRSFTMDIDKTKKDLGYIPKYNYIEYLKDFKKEMKKNRFKDLWTKKEEGDE